jgi:protein TonB
VFEQSILLKNEASRPWNFVAPFGAEMLIAGLAILIPLASSDHLPAFHWHSVALRSAPAPPAIERVAARSSRTSSMLSLVPAPRPIFRFDHEAVLHPAQTLVAFSSEAPPSIGADGPGNGAGPVGVLSIPPPTLPPPQRTAASAPVKVGGSVQMAKLIRRVIPEYPALARAARISGVVHLLGTIGKDGTIRNLRLVDGHPMLARAAVEAVEQWVYEPTLLNGEPVEVIAPIEVSFTLGQ